MKPTPEKLVATWLTPEKRKQAKIKAAQKDLTLRDYLEKLIEDDKA